MFRIFGIGKKEENDSELNPAVHCSAEQLRLAGEKISSVKVLGTGCKKCNELFAELEKAVAAMELQCEKTHVTELEEVMKYNVTATPALVCNERVLCAGRTLKASQICGLLVRAAESL